MRIIIWSDRERCEFYRPADSRALPVEVSYFPMDGSPEELAAQAPDTEILLVDALLPVTASLMGSLPRLKLIHVDAVGYNGVDLAAAQERGIYVCNCRGCNCDAVAEVAVMLMLMLTRLSLPGHQAVVEGRQWAYKTWAMGANLPEFADHTIGLLGLGDIGAATARRLRPFGNKLLYYAPHRRPPEVEEDLGVSYRTLEELAEECDILSLHCPLTPETTGIVNGELLARMKPGSYLINTSRGLLMDDQAVLAALQSGQLAGAGFDTLWPEPTPADHPLVALPPELRDKVALLPHLGGNTGPAYFRVHRMMWDNVARMLRGECPEHVVNGL